MLPTSLYIHIPWCIKKCPYCDFNSHQKQGSLPEKAYIDALIEDLDADLALHQANEIHSIFIGGGTPSLLSGEMYALLFEQIQKRIALAPEIEITLEANPGTVEHGRFESYREAGINRLSLGIQSFNSQHLKTLGRIHDETQARRAIENARKAGFENINLDLMHSLPGQTLTEGLADLQEAIACQPEHISWYQLTLEPNTVFYKQQPILPDEDTSAELEAQGFALLEKQGYARYEISAFSRPGLASIHNLNYWQFGDYYGIGAGAHGKLSLNQTDILRTQKTRMPKDYLNPQKLRRCQTHARSPETLIFEFMLNATRLQAAIPFTLFTERTGLPLTDLLPKLVLAEQKKLITLSENSWQISTLGRRFTNNLQALFLPENLPTSQMYKND